MRFLLDENVHSGLFSFLLQMGHDAKSSPKGLSNGDLFALAISEKRVLITHDTDFAREAPTEKHPGIILLKIPPRNIEALKFSLQDFLSKKPSPELSRDRLFLLFEDHFDEFPFRAEEIKR